MTPEPTPAERLYAKIPEVKPGTGFVALWLSKFQIKQLDDQEFIFLYCLPGAIIHVAKSTANYIERRRRELRLFEANVQMSNDI